MADYEFPDDLLAAQRAYYTADARVQEVTDALPSSQEILEGFMTDEQRAELAEVREARLQALEALNNHPWWATADNRHAAWMALQKAAKG
ncbi:hypothetical protein AB0395_48080 [Streptosporangium sp. NPDC051023]|uniref:hypothetical protein n=1 Tax=Streptosporangium sp. NPDC051023 TaxID=3155410 RepID=UPI00344D978A